jgi:hypothetical protein
MNTLIISSIPTLAAILAIGAALARIVLTGNRSLARRIDDTNIRIDSLEDNLGKRIDENSSEIRALDAKFSDEFIDINHRFDVVNQRFDSVNQRIDKVLNLAQSQPSVA